MAVLNKTGDACPKAGYWRQIETGFTYWHEVGGIFAPSINDPLTRAYYEFVSDVRDDESH